MATRTENLVGKLSIHDAEWRAGLARASSTFRLFSSGIAKVGAGSWSGITKGLGASLNGAVSMASNAVGKIKSIVGAAGIAGIIAGVAGGFSLGSILGEAADHETAITQFETILGSVDKAKERIADLTAFAAKTPFELPETLNASRQLQVFTKGALATGKGLTLIGDIAASTGQGFSEVAFWVGRMYDALSSGRPAGEAFMRLQEMGAISGDTRGKLEKLSESGAGMAQIWGLFTAETKQFAGGMERLSKTYSGMMSTLSDAFGALKRSFGGPILQAMKPIIQWITANLEGLQAKAAQVGASVAKWMTSAFAAFKGGNLTEFFFGKEFVAKATMATNWATTLWKTISSGEGLSYLMDSLKLAALTAGNYFIGTMQTGVNMLGQTLATLFKGETLMGLANSFTGLAMIFGSALLEALADPILFLQAGLEFGIIQAGTALMEVFKHIGPVLDAMSFPLRKMVEVVSGIKMPAPSEQIASNLPGFRERAKLSFGDILAEHKAEGVNFAGYAPSEMRDQGMAMLGSGGTALQEAGRGLAAGVISEARKFRPSNFFDASGPQSNVVNRMGAQRQAPSTGSSLFDAGRMERGAAPAGFVWGDGKEAKETRAVLSEIAINTRALRVE